MEREFVQLFGDVCRRLGIPRSYGQIYGLAFVAREPISFEDVVSRLSMSAGSASQGLRWLRKAGALLPAGTRVGRKGSACFHRREYYVPQTNPRSLLQLLVESRVQRPLKTGLRRLLRLRKMIDTIAGDAADEQTQHFSERLRHVEAWHGRTALMAPVLYDFAD